VLCSHIHCSWELAGSRAVPHSSRSAHSPHLRITAAMLALLASGPAKRTHLQRRWPPDIVVALGQQVQAGGLISHSSSLLSDPCRAAALLAASRLCYHAVTEA